MIVKKILSVFLLLAMVVSYIQFGDGKIIANAANKELTATEIANYFNNRVGGAYASGWCLAFVADGFAALGAVRSSACCAYNYGTNHIVSNSQSNIPVGADIFFFYTGIVCDVCGNNAGHVGVYVGDGYVVHAAQGIIKKEKLTDIAVNTISYRGWGYHGNISIIGITAPTNAWISMKKSQLAINEEITFDFHADNIEGGHYILHFYKDGVNIDNPPSGYSYYSRSFTEAGNYSAYVTGYNTAGASCNSTSVPFIVYNSVPSIPIINTTKSFYSPGENITINITIPASATSSYMTIRDINENPVFSQDVTGCSSYNLIINTVGYYKIEYQSANNYGVSPVATTNFTVGVAPGSPTLTVSSNNRSTDHVVFNWEATSNTTSYDLRVSQGGNTVKTIYGITSLQYSLLLPVGSYEAWLCSVNGNSEDIWTGPANKPSFTVVQADYVPQKTVTYDGHVYSLYDNFMTWKEAKSLCESMGGHLATITSEDEQDAINGLLASGNQPAYFIGGTDEAVEGTFEWVTGEPFGYTNWNTNQPDNWNGDEDYLMLYSAADTFGKWNDLDSYIAVNVTYRGFICEIEPAEAPISTTTYNGSKYMLFDSSYTWEDANAMCKKFGGHLVTITSTGEQQTMEALISNGNATAYHIGGTDKISEGVFEWITGEPFTYSNWVAGQPDNYFGTEEYASMYKNHATYSGKWNDLNNFAADSAFVGKMGFICEIPSAPTIEATPQTRTNGDVTISITFPIASVNKQFKIGDGTWTAYTEPIVLHSNATIYAKYSDVLGYTSEISSLVVSNIIQIGDVNGDNAITSVDALMALQAAASNISLDEAQILASDVNNDGKVSSLDALKILQYAAGLIANFD